MKTFSALLWRPGTNHLGNPDPVVGTLGLDELEEISIFALRPRSPFMGAHYVAAAMNWGVATVNLLEASTQVD